MNKSIDDYRRKRDFAQTPEPQLSPVSQGTPRCSGSIGSHSMVLQLSFELTTISERSSLSTSATTGISRIVPLVLQVSKRSAPSSPL